MTPIHVGLIGFGNWAQQAYLPTLQQLPNVKVTAVAARSDATRQAARRALGDTIQTHDDPHALLADQRLDAVMINLPNALHARAVADAVAAGKHVFFEPPLGLNEQEVQRALDAVSGSNRVIQADLELRYLPVVRAVRELLKTDRVGPPRTAKVALTCDWLREGGYRDQNAERSGFFLWLGEWYLDLLDVVFAAAPSRIEVVGGYAGNGDLMDHGFATLAYPDRGIGLFAFDLLGGPSDAQITLHVTTAQAQIVADIQRGTYRWRHGDGPWQQHTADCLRPAHGFVGMRESVTDFFKAIADARPADAGPDVIRRLSAASLAATASEQRGRSDARLSPA